MNPTIALCMIVKNEAAGLDDALESASQWVDEMIVVDTGSSDDSVAIARKAGASVHQFEFANGVDLGRARTRSIELASTQWALLLDGDTVLDGSSGPLLREIAARCSEPPRTVLGLWRNYSRTGDGSFDTFNRTMLPLGEDRSLIGRRHEYFVDANGEVLQSVRVPEIIVHHWGFTDENIARKETVQNNAEVALLQLRERPEYSMFWIDAIRAHGFDAENRSLALPLIAEFKHAARNGEITQLGNVAQYQISFYEALIAFAADRFEDAYDAALSALSVSPSMDMLAVQAAVNASRGFDSIACEQLELAESLGGAPHPLTGVPDGSHVTSQMLALVGQAAARLGHPDRSKRWLDVQATAERVI